MSSANFEYLRESAPVLAELGAFAEQYLKSDPDSALTKLRGFCEASVRLLYQHQGWPVPERFTLDQLIRESEFTDAYPKSVLLKLDYLRVHGNKGAHNARATSSDALAVLREAHRIGQFLYLEVFAGQEARLSNFVEPSSTSKPSETGQARLKRDANINEMMGFLAKEASKSKPTYSGLGQHDDASNIPAFLLDPTHPNYRAPGERDNAGDSLEPLDPPAARDASAIPSVYARIEQKDASDNIPVSSRHKRQKGQETAERLGFNEAETRRQLIDVQLARAGWSVSDEEVVVVERPVEHQPTETGIGYIDYVLKHRESGQVLAVVEAKRCAKDPADGRKQARLYADGIEKETGARPVIFYTNGYETWLWDDHETSQSPPRKVHAFYTCESLEYLIWRRSAAKKLSSISPNQEILSDRDYQYESLGAICGAFDRGRRRALAVQATGTGKTRLAVALTDVVLKANAGRRILFLCDRRELRKQAKNAFDAFLSAPSTFLSKDSLGELSNQLYFATYPAMAKIYKQIDPGFFDLIIADESHRSIYNVYGDLFRYFDGLQLGLTATPVEMVSRSTCRMFGCEFGEPTANYPLERAIKEEYLVPFSVVKHTTRFLREGIKGDTLTPEQVLEAEERGEDLTQLDFDAEQIDRAIHNKDTNRMVLRNLMENGLCLADGQTLGKSIIFARNHRHALLLEELFNEMYPQYGGRFCQVIDNYVERADQLIDDFKSNEASTQDFRIAVSVDMLDTGIDVPEILNIVFARPVKSPIKFMQMVGRGTRLCKDLFGPGKHKSHFQIFDHWGVVEAHALNDYEPTVSNSKPLAQKLFESRLALARAALDMAEPALFEKTVEQLLSMIKGLDKESISVREQWRAMQAVSHRNDLMKLAPETVVLLETQISPLMRYLDIRGSNAAYSWDLLISDLSNSKLNATARFEDLAGEAADRVVALRLSINRVKEKEELIKEARSSRWWLAADLDSIEMMRASLRDVMQFSEESQRPELAAVVTDIPDTEEISESQQTYFAEVDYANLKSRVKSAIQDLSLDVDGLLEIRNGLPVNDRDLEALHARLQEVDPGADLALLLEIPQRTRDESLSKNAILRSVIGLDYDFVRSAFNYIVSEVDTSARKRAFIHALTVEICEKGFIGPSDLYQKKFSIIGDVEQLFSNDQLDALFGALKHFSPTWQF